MSADSIRDQVNVIRSMASIHTESKLRTMYNDFLDKYPKLFAAAIDPTFPLTFLDQMLQQMESLNKNEIKLDDADKIIYGDLQKKFIDPFIPTDTKNIQSSKST